MSSVSVGCGRVRMPVRARRRAGLVALACLAGLVATAPAQDAGGGALADAQAAEAQPADATAQAETLALGRRVAERLAAGETEALWDDMTADMRGVFGTVEALAAFVTQVGEQLGPVKQMLSEETQVADGTRAYVRTAQHEKAPMPILLQAAFDEAGRVAGLVVRPVPREAASEHLERATVAELRLPFEGAWTVFWGGRTLAQNYHAAFADQRFAYDLLAMQDGRSHRGEGKDNADYHCWDRPILSPGAGTVVVAVDGVEDNVPGVMDPRHPPGNHVVVDHGHGEYSLLAHFRNGTVAVEVGQQVDASTLLGRCGNSGNSSEPHLHYHLQDAPAFGKGVGLPAQFVGYLADGEAVGRGEPVKGQVVERAP